MSTIADTHPEIHAQLADYYQALAEYHSTKAANPLAVIPIPKKPTA
tara:strand:+ start:3598 stop:3735 length:138 start_codon:yes stop_codon:yes gene_type:complete